jgi:hypothetical protein
MTAIYREVVATNKMKIIGLVFLEIVFLNLSDPSIADPGLNLPITISLSLVISMADSEGGIGALPSVRGRHGTHAVQQSCTFGPSIGPNIEPQTSPAKKDLFEISLHIL